MKSDNEHTIEAARQTTKTRILEAAQQTFAERGFDGASTREIAARAGVNISSLHYHWDSKETLYRGIFVHIYGRLVDLLEDEISQPASAEEARAMIEKTMGLIFDVFAEDPTIPKLLLRRLIESPEPEASTQTVLGTPWEVFQQWTREFAGGKLDSQEISFLLLTIQSVLLVSMLESPQVAAMVGGPIREPERRARLRTWLIDFVEDLVQFDSGGPKK